MFLFLLVATKVVNLTERTRSGLITGLDQTVRVMNSCNSGFTFECNLGDKVKTGWAELNIYILGVFTEKPYNKPLERREVYIPITTSSPRRQRRQNKPYLSTVWLDNGAVPHFAEQLRTNILLL